MSGFALPDLGEGLQEAEIVAWHVAEGDHVVADQPLVAVETAKAVVEIPSPRSGRIAQLFGKPGDRVAIGAPLVAFADSPSSDGGTVVGVLPEPPRPAHALPSEAVHPHGLAAPAIRALARERGVDLMHIAGSGPDGTVTRADVEAAGVPVAEETFETLGGVRRAMAIAMARAHAEIVPASLWDDADVARWWAPASDVSARLLRAIARACVAVPALNAFFDGPTLTRRLMTRVDIGIAVDTEDGLIVPVLRDVGNRDATDLRRGLDTLAAATRARSVALADLRDATITLSNFGMLGGRDAALVVMPPQVAIVGAGRIASRPVASAAGITARATLPLSLTFDHRAVTGGEAARFVAAMITDLQCAE